MMMLSSPQPSALSLPPPLPLPPPLVLRGATFAAQVKISIEPTFVSFLPLALFANALSLHWILASQQRRCLLKCQLSFGSAFAGLPSAASAIYIHIIYIENSHAETRLHHKVLSWQACES